MEKVEVPTVSANDGDAVAVSSENAMAGAQVGDEVENSVKVVVTPGSLHN
jgi:hypothetical protein